MKTILLLFIIISFKSFSQDPNLVRTWYLTERVVNGISDPVPSNLGRAAILTIASLDTQTIQTNLCNDNFVQGVSFDNVLLNYSGVASTLITCNDSNNNNFDNWYSNFFRNNIPTGLNYFITQNGDNYTLRLTSMLMSEVIYQSQPLSTENFSKTALSLAPNPAENFISITTNDNLVDVQVTIYNTLGQIISTQKHASIPENIDVSTLNSGMYYLEIVSSMGKETKKFIKK